MSASSSSEKTADMSAWVRINNRNDALISEDNIMLIFSSVGRQFLEYDVALRFNQASATWPPVPHHASVASIGDVTVSGALLDFEKA